jgi:transposase
MENEDTLLATKIIKLRNVKLNPTKEQKLLLRKYEAAARYTYNATVAAVNGGDKLNKMSLRNNFVTSKENPWIADKVWLTETPKAIRQQAVFEVVKNFKAAFTNKANGNIEKFKMTFRRKGRHNAQRPWTLGIEKAVKKTKDDDLVIFPETIGKMRYYGKLPFDDKPEAECGIHRNAKGDYFLRVPVKVQVKKQKPPKKIIAMDPGVRKFVTGYSPTENHGFYAGKETDKRILEIHKNIDLVNSELSSPSVDCVRRRRLRKKKMRLYADLKNVRDDFHWKLANMLTVQYDRILLPHLETAKLSRGLKAKVSRAMLSQSHGLFSQRLAEKCKERGVTFEEPSERHTSKTCGRCGMLTNVGSSETFACRCGYVADRDLNAARNIYIRAETFTES